MTTNWKPWLRRMLLSITLALACGLLAFLVARAAGSLALFVEHQQLLAEVGGVLQGGIEGPPASDLRAARQELDRLANHYLRLSLLVGFAMAALAAVGVYLWLERRGVKSEE